MTRIIKTIVYEFNELDKSGKQKAREWYLQGGLDYEWHDTVIDDFKTIAEILGLRLKTREVNTIGGKSSEEAEVFFSGFSSQGDGASFKGVLEYKKGCCKAIREHAPEDKKLHQIADTLFELQRRNCYELVTTIGQRGSYVHAYTMDFGVERYNSNRQEPTEDAEETIKETMQDLAMWLYRTLEKEYEHLTSDETVEQTIEANEWSFHQKR